MMEASPTIERDYEELKQQFGLGHSRSGIGFCSLMIPMGRT